MAFPLFELAKLFPASTPLILSLVTAGLDTCGTIFFFVRMFYEAGVPFSTLFISYAILFVLCSLLSYFYVLNFSSEASAAAEPKSELKQPLIEKKEGEDDKPKVPRLELAKAKLA